MMRLPGSFQPLRLLQFARYQQSYQATPASILQRGFKTATASQPSTPDFAFAFDIDGVLLRSAKPLPGASESLSLLQKQNIPFILLTNGGGKYETERVADLSRSLGVDLGPGSIIQSHTPFMGLVRGTGKQDSLENKCVLVVGGEGDKCRHVAGRYGFKSVVTPADILVAHPEISPFSSASINRYKEFARPLPRPAGGDHPSSNLKIDAVLVFNDSRDWALDIQVIIDVLLSSQGVLGTYSDKNHRNDLPNRGFQQDGQPPIYFSNPDLWWAAAYPLPRLGQGGFREALEGAWDATTRETGECIKLQKSIIGKPHQETYEFAEKRLLCNRADMLGEAGLVPLRTVYMVGDNPESDIRGANSYVSGSEVNWQSILVRSGVYNGGEPTWKPKSIVDGVRDAVQWGLESSGWPLTKK